MFTKCNLWQGSHRSRKDSADRTIIGRHNGIVDWRNRIVYPVISSCLVIYEKVTARKGSFMAFGSSQTSKITIFQKNPVYPV